MKPKYDKDSALAFSRMARNRDVQVLLDQIAEEAADLLRACAAATLVGDHHIATVRAARYSALDEVLQGIAGADEWLAQQQSADADDGSF